MSPRREVILTGGSFNFVHGNAPTNLTVEIAKAYQKLGYTPRIIPQNPSFSHEEQSSGLFCGVPYAYPLKDKNIFTGYSGWRKSLNYRLGVLLNPVLTGFCIWKNRKNLSHVFSEDLRPATLLILVVACRFSRIRFIYHLVEEPWNLEIYKDTSGWLQFSRMVQRALPIFCLYLVVLRMASVVACITDELISLLERWGYSNRKLFYLPSVRNIDESDNDTWRGRRDVPTGKGNDSTTPYIMYSGQISSTKEAFEPSMKALKQVNKDKIRIRLQIYGGGDPLAIERLKRMVVKLDVAEYVRFFGFVSREELLMAQQTAMLCLLLKRDVPFNRFNFPTKLIDYLCAGKAVLMSNLPLHQRYFTDKIDSLMVDPESVDEIQHALEWALEHPKEISILGQKASLKLQKHFRADINIQRLLEYALIDVPCRVADSVAYE